MNRHGTQEVFMRVLFIGGTGNISTPCARLALEKGVELSLMVRGHSPRLFSGVADFIHCDIRNPEMAAAALKNREFDTVVDWVAYLPEHVETDIALFRGKTRQYVFISSAAVYQKPPSYFVVTESMPLSNPFWQYARAKIACEERLGRAFRDEGFPVTIVRPSHTYGETRIPSALNVRDYTIVERMKRGKKIIVHGDGQSLWVMTHATDFAKALVGMLGKPESIGERYHITSDEVLTWDQIYTQIGDAAGLEPDLIHIPSEFIALFDEEVGAGLLGDKAYSMMFDNSKIKRLMPEFRATTAFTEGIRRSLAWFEADASRKTVTSTSDALMDRIIQHYQRALPYGWTRHTATDTSGRP
jgi:nucleoside-diphosphate-sugar epimerase